MPSSRRKLWVSRVKTDSTHPAAAMRMLTYFINRAGRDLSATRRAELGKAKALLSKRIQRGKWSIPQAGPLHRYSLFGPRKIPQDILISRCVQGLGLLHLCLAGQDAYIIHRNQDSWVWPDELRLVLLAIGKEIEPLGFCFRWTMGTIRPPNCAQRGWPLQRACCRFGGRTF